MQQGFIGKLERYRQNLWGKHTPRYTYTLLSPSCSGVM